jgi:sugar/nucleoside kinase (ribokinase family)
MNDVYLYGMISASTVYVLDEKFTYPEPNQYAEIRQYLPSLGGEAVNSAIMLSKLGVKTKLDGNWINPKKADIMHSILKPFDIDITRLTYKENYGTEEIVITDRDSRTIFGNYASFHSGEKQWNTPFEQDVINAKMVAIDPYFKVEAPAIAQMCVKHAKPYVTLDCRYEDFLTQHAEAVIISHELRDQAYPGCNMTEIFEKYQETCKGLIIFTFGSDELWYGRKGQPIMKFKPYKIKPVDTTGAGDTFRAGIIYGFLKSWNDKEIITFASAVAACVCLTIPHSINAPGLEGVLRFMEENKLQKGKIGNCKNCL